MSYIVPSHFAGYVLVGGIAEDKGIANVASKRFYANLPSLLLSASED